MITNFTTLIDIPDGLTTAQTVHLIETFLKEHYEDVWRFQPSQGIEQPRVVDTSSHSPDGVCSTDVLGGHRDHVEVSLVRAWASVAPTGDV